MTLLITDWLSVIPVAVDEQKVLYKIMFWTKHTV